MTTATHHQICQILRRSPPVLRLGIYREKIDAYRTPHTSISGRSSTVSSPVNVPVGVPNSVEPVQEEFQEVHQNYCNTNSPDYIKFEEGSGMLECKFLITILLFCFLIVQRQTYIYIFL